MAMCDVWCRYSFGGAVLRCVCKVVYSDAICQRIRPRDRVGALADEHARTGKHGWLVRFFTGVCG
jgi:hypothetical protein